MCDKQNAMDVMTKCSIYVIRSIGTGPENPAVAEPIFYNQKYLLKQHCQIYNTQPLFINYYIYILLQYKSISIFQPFSSLAWQIPTIDSSHCRSTLDKNSVFTNITSTPGGKLLYSDCIY